MAMSSGPISEQQHAVEIALGHRFAFGANWTRFLRDVDEARIADAMASLCAMLECTTLSGRRFLDIGSGSGLFSLAARRLGAEVTSFDYDHACVACTQALKDRFYRDDSSWRIAQGSALDLAFVESLGGFDVVYSWGVLHHTGAMWEALANAAVPVAPGGVLFIAIYNDQGRMSRVWTWIKRLYNGLPMVLRFIVIVPTFLRLRGPLFVRSVLRGQPLALWRSTQRGRGMSQWSDFIDWIGGLPFEVAKPEAIFDFYRQRGFTISKLKTCGGGYGCNEFVFSAPPAMDRQ